MLPNLHKTHNQESSRQKLYNPPKQMSNAEIDKKNYHHQSRPSSQTKGAGFKRKSILESNKGVEKILVPPKSPFILKSSIDLANEIKLIEKKIRICKKKIDEQKKIKQQSIERAQRNQYDRNFEQIVRKQINLHSYQIESEQKGYDYLTNPGKELNQESAEIEEQSSISHEPQKKHETYNINKNLQKLQKHYENSLKHKFQRRQMFPHQPCRRKTPKLYITQKNNAVSKIGKPQTQQQHMFRIYTRQTTPQQIQPVIPNFNVVKDNLSKNIIAYLSEYKPFVDKAKIPEKQKNEQIE